MSKILDALRRMIEKFGCKPQPANRVAIFEQDFILRHAEHFLHGLRVLDESEAILTRDELTAMFWVFGKMVAGDMEQRVHYYEKLVNNAIMGRPVYNPLFATHPSTEAYPKEGEE